MHQTGFRNVPNVAAACLRRQIRPGEGARGSEEDVSQNKETRGGAQGPSAGVSQPDSNTSLKR